MSPSVVASSVCADCYRCEKDRKVINGEERIDVRCELPARQTVFGLIRNRGACPDFFPRAVLLA